MKKTQFNIWLSKNWKWVIGGIIGLILLIIIYKAIKKSGAKAHQVGLPSDIVGQELTQEEIDYLRAFAENLHQDIFEIWGVRDTELYQELSLLSDTKLVALSNIYNAMYEKDDEETFYVALDNEVFAFSTSTKVDTVLKRLRDLGVS